jgi:hypothetical protein
MNQAADDTIAPEMCEDEEYAMPCAEAMLASALALMTGYMQGCCDDHRTQMAQKIVQHLVSLSQHPMLSPDFKTLLWNLHSRWLAQTRAPAAPAPLAQASAALWHPTHEVLQ